MLKFSQKHNCKSVIGYDIDEKCFNNFIFNNDSLLNIPKSNSFILTNPPYLAKNKMPKKLKEKYLNNDIEDFYHLALKRIIDADFNDGIIIIPINFFSAENSDKIRKEFLDKYSIEKINYFMEQVFLDTTYNVVAFNFYKDNSKTKILKFKSFPDKKEFVIKVDGQYNYKIGGEELSKILNCEPKLKIKRLTTEIINKNIGNIEVDCFYNDYDTIEKFKINKKLKTNIDNNIIILNCIDGKNNKICAEDIRFYNKNCLVGKITSRNIAYILIDNIAVDIQYKLIEKFNKKLNELRKAYDSLFLTNFRDNNRKRISFDFCYKLLNYCYNELL